MPQGDYPRRELSCPQCGATIRARMADAPDEAPSSAEPGIDWRAAYEQTVGPAARAQHVAENLAHLYAVIDETRIRPDVALDSLRLMADTQRQFAPASGSGPAPAHPGTARLLAHLDDVAAKATSDDGMFIHAADVRALLLPGGEQT